MASQTLSSVSDRFGVGTTVSVYPKPQGAAWDGTGTPPGSVVTTAVVASDGSVTFTGLTEGSFYVASAGGVSRSFRCDPQAAVAATGGSAGAVVVAAGSQSGTYTLDCTGKKDILLTITLAAATVTVSPTNMSAGQSITVVATQDATGSRTFVFNPAAKKAGGVAFAFSTTAAAVDVFSAFSPDGTVLYGFTSGRGMA